MNIKQLREQINTAWDAGDKATDAEKSALMHSHLADVPKDQYPKFRDTFNHLRRQAGQQ